MALHPIHHHPLPSSSFSFPIHTHGPQEGATVDESLLLNEAQFGSFFLAMEDEEAEEAGVDPEEREARRHAALAAEATLDDVFAMDAARDASMARTRAAQCTPVTGMQDVRPVAAASTPSYAAPGAPSDIDEDDYDDDVDDMLLLVVMAGAELLLAGQGSGAWFHRRRVPRVTGGPFHSTIAGYLTGDDATYLFKFRMTKQQLWDASKALAEHGFLRDNSGNRDVKYRYPGRFKFATCMYVVAHGANGSSQYGAAADAAGLGESTVESYMWQFVRGVCSVLGPVYLPREAPSPELVRRVLSEFAARRGVPNVALAVDGTHVPYAPLDAQHEHLYRNYKGWYSLHVLAYVNSFHLFVAFRAGDVGRTSDARSLRNCGFLDRLKNGEREAFLGQDGLIAGDGGTSDEDGILLVPIPGAESIEDIWYNFCHSSTRFFVEEVFGRWKNRFRVFMTPMRVGHEMATMIVASTIVLHNYITATGGSINHDEYSFGRDEAWDQHFRDFRAMLCPSCNRAGALHCVHIERNRQVRPVRPSARGEDMRQRVRDRLWEQQAQVAGFSDFVREEVRARQDRRDAQRSLRADGSTHTHAVDDEEDDCSEDD